MEIIVSIAILGGTVAVVGEMARASFQNARMARDLIQAELLAESIMAKIRLGIIEMEPVYDIPVGADRADIIADTHATVDGDARSALWLYSIEIVAVSESEYLVEIAVTVRQNEPSGRQSAVCRLVRWCALEPEEEEEE
jgi:hypothetical protein